MDNLHRQTFLAKLSTVNTESVSAFEVVEKLWLTNSMLDEKSQAAEAHDPAEVAKVIQASMNPASIAVLIVLLTEGNKGK